MKTQKIRATVALIATAVGGGELAAKDKHPKTVPAKPQDQIAIEAHIAFSDGPVTHFIATQHYDRSYVYAERARREAGHSDRCHEPRAPTGSCQHQSGSAVGQSAGSGWRRCTGQTIRLMNFSDPANPKGHEAVRRRHGRRKSRTPHPTGERRRYLDTLRTPRAGSLRRRTLRQKDHLRRKHMLNR